MTNTTSTLALPLGAALLAGALSLVSAAEATPVSLPKRVGIEAAKTYCKTANREAMHPFAEGVLAGGLIGHGFQRAYTGSEFSEAFTAFKTAAAYYCAPSRV